MHVLIELYCIVLYRIVTSDSIHSFFSIIINLGKKLLQHTVIYLIIISQTLNNTTNFEDNFVE